LPFAVKREPLSALVVAIATARQVTELFELGERFGKGGERDAQVLGQPRGRRQLGDGEMREDRRITIRETHSR